MRLPLGDRGHIRLRDTPHTYWPCHLGIDNLNVVRSIGRLLDADCLSKPLSLVKDGDLVALVQYMIRSRGRDTVRVTKVKGHAKDADDVQHGRVRLLDRLGNIEADIAADLGRRHQTELLIDARRRLLQARSYWYPIMADLHRFMVAFARVSVNHGKGGMAPDPLVWDQESRPKVRKLAIRVTVDLASLPGPSGFLNNSWVQVHAGHITGADNSAWPSSVGILVWFTSFLGTLHWPSGSLDLGHYGISFLDRASYPFRAMGWTPIA